MVTKTAEKQQPSPTAGGKSATKWIMTLLSSSLGQKFVMGITGLLLCSFLVVHLAGNLLVYVGADAYNSYAHDLHSMLLLPVAETGLFLLLFAHIALAFKLTSEFARDTGQWITKRLSQAHSVLLCAGLASTSYAATSVPAQIF